jgi:drug/metabolite transporter (DMT)-like permease
MTSTTSVATPRTETLAVVSLLASGVIWGLMWMPLKFFAAQGLTGLAMTLSTYGLVGAVALPFIWMQRQAWRPQAHLLLMAGLFGGIANSCFITALMFGEVMRVMLLFYLAPVWGVLGGAVFLGERITLARAAGMALAVVGAVLVLGGSEALARPFARSDLLGLASGLFYAITNIVSRAGDRIPIASKSLVVFTGCGVVSALLFPLFGGGYPQVSPLLTLSLLGFAGLWLTSAMWTTMYGVTHLEAGRSSVLLVFELVAAVLSAMLIGGERLSGIEWIGAALIVSAALIEARVSSSPREKSERAKCRPIG